MNDGSDLIIRTIIDLAKTAYPDAPIGWLLGICVGILRRSGVTRKEIIGLVDAALNTLASMPSKELPS